MDSSPPKQVLESFLRRKGLACGRRVERDEFNRVVEWTGPSLAVRLSVDLGISHLEVSDVEGRPDEWYDVAIIQVLVDGAGDDVLPLERQTNLVERNWATLLDIFGPARRVDSHARLQELRRARLERRMSSLRLKFSRRPRESGA